MTELEIRQSGYFQTIMSKIMDMVKDKYWKGAKEHGGCLGDMSEEDLIKNIEEEAIDMLVYVAALKLKRANKKLKIEGTVF